MEIFRFLKWWWSGLGTAYKPFFIMLLFLIVEFTAGMVFGVVGVLAVLATLILAAISYLIYLAVGAIGEQWKEYCVMRDKEAERIVAKLRGQE